jgi:hypothetical protein
MKCAMEDPSVDEVEEEREQSGTIGKYAKWEAPEAGSG